MTSQRSIQEDIHFTLPHLSELFHTIREFFIFTKDYMQAYQEGFVEREIRDYYGKVVSSSVEKIELMLTQFLNFMKVSVPARKVDTVRILIEEVLEKHTQKIEEKRIPLSVKFEEGLPEITIPKAQLFFILDVLVECLITLVSSEGKLWISAKTILLDGKTNAISTLGSGKSVELILASANSKVTLNPPPRVAAPPQVQILDLMLPVVKEIVRRNRGMMKWQQDEKKETVAINIRFPIERRVLAYYELLESTERDAQETKSTLSFIMEGATKLAGGIAHELNNALTPVIGNADLLLQDTKPHEPAYPLVRAIIEGAERAGRLGKNLLIVGLGHPIKPAVMNLNDLILSMEKKLEHIGGARMQCQFLLEPDLMSIKADRFLMEQLILNLVTNARDAMPRAGRVKIATENTRLDERYCRAHPEATPGNHARMVFSDTGAGIPSHMLDHLFEPYQDIKPGGGGLGLSIVYSIVKQFNGHITVRSKEGEGTTFQIYIPAFGIGDEIPKPLAAAKSQTLLVVESESELLKRLHKSFFELGYIVLPAASSEEAIGKITNHAGSIDLLVTNIVLPGKSGIDLAKDLWTKYPRMKTIFLTSCPEDWKFIFKDKVQVVEKPVDLNILLDRVRHELGN